MPNIAIHITIIITYVKFTYWQTLRKKKNSRKTNGKKWSWFYYYNRYCYYLFCLFFFLYFQCLLACIAYVMADVGNSRNQYLPPDNKQAGYNYNPPQSPFGNSPAPVRNEDDFYFVLRINKRRLQLCSSMI